MTWEVLYHPTAEFCFKKFIYHRVNIWILLIIFWLFDTGQIATLRRGIGSIRLDVGDGVLIVSRRDAMLELPAIPIVLMRFFFATAGSQRCPLLMKVTVYECSQTNQGTWSTKVALLHL